MTDSKYYAGQRRVITIHDSVENRINDYNAVEEISEYDFILGKKLSYR